MGAKKWTAKEVECLIANWGKCDAKELENSLHKSYESIRRKASRLNLPSFYSGKLMPKEWSKEDKEYLSSNMYRIPFIEIADKLNRPISAVYSMAYSLGYRSKYNQNENFITFTRLISKFRQYNYNSNSVRIFIKNHNIPVKTLVAYKSPIRIVFYSDFWKWAEFNRKLIDFSKIRKGELGKEPDWVDKQRKLDIENSSLFLKRNTFWTKEDDEKLIQLNNLNLSMSELEDSFNRTSSSISSRLYILNIKFNGSKTQKKWTDEECAILEEMVLCGCSVRQIADCLCRSSSSICNKLFVLYGTKSLDKARKIILE